MFISCGYKVAAPDPATVSPFQAGGGKEDNKGKLVVLLAKSVILLREFSRGFQTFFFLLTSHWPDLCQATIPISREAGKYLLVWLIVLPTKSGSAIKKERMGTG